MLHILQGQGVRPEQAARPYSMSSEGHAADKAALQGFAKTKDTASSPARPTSQQQPAKVRHASNMQPSCSLLMHHA